MEQIAVPITISVVAALIGWFGSKSYDFTKQHEESHTILKEANLFQIKAILIYMYKKACESDHKATMYELDVFNDLYDVYTRLGGNSFIESMHEKMNDLDVEDVEEE